MVDGFRAQFDYSIQENFNFYQKGFKLQKAKNGISASYIVS